MTSKLQCNCNECNCREVGECSEFPCSCCWLQHGKGKMMSEREVKYAKLPLEQIFNNKTARLLDHLTTMMPFQFTFDELMSILQIERLELESILLDLTKFDLIAVAPRKKYKINDNPRTLALRKFIHEVAVDNIEKIASRTRRGTRQ